MCYKNCQIIIALIIAIVFSFEQLAYADVLKTMKSYVNTNVSRVNSAAQSYLSGKANIVSNVSGVTQRVNNTSAAASRQFLINSSALNVSVSRLLAVSTANASQPHANNSTQLNISSFKFSPAFHNNSTALMNTARSSSPVASVVSNFVNSYNSWHNSLAAGNRQAMPIVAKVYDEYGTSGLAVYALGKVTNPVLERITGYQAGSHQLMNAAQNSYNRIGRYTSNRYIDLRGMINLPVKLLVGKDLARPYASTQRGLSNKIKSITPQEILGYTIGAGTGGRGLSYLTTTTVTGSTPAVNFARWAAPKVCNYAKEILQNGRNSESLVKYISFKGVDCLAKGAKFILAPSMAASSVFYASGNYQAGELFNMPNMFMVSALIEAHGSFQDTLGWINNNTIKTDIGDKIWNAQYGKLAFVTKQWDQLVDVLTEYYWVKNIGSDNYRDYLKPAARAAGLAGVTLFSGGFAGVKGFLGGGILAVTSGISADSLEAVNNKQPYVQLIVNSSIQNGINSSLERYAEDLKKEGYKVNIVDDRKLKTPQELREHLRKEYQENKLTGAVLIGDLPIVKYNILNGFVQSETFPTDLYFMDLKGNWQDANSDGVLDAHPVNSKKNLDIYVGRIPASPFSYNASAPIINITTDKNSEGEKTQVRFMDRNFNASRYDTLRVNISTQTKDAENPIFFLSGNTFSHCVDSEHFAYFSSQGFLSIEIPLDKISRELTSGLNLIQMSQIERDTKKINSLEFLGGGENVTIFSQNLPQNLAANKTREIAILNDYFKKNHEFRSGNLSKSDKALLYIDDDWHESHEERSNIIGLIYGNVTDIYNPDQTIALNYLHEIQTGNYSWVSLSAHSSPNEHFSGNLKSEEIKSAKPYFYQLFACSAADYTQPNFLAGRYLFGEENQGLVSISSTKNGGMLNENSFYESLQKKNSIGKAFTDWANDNAIYNDNAGFRNRPVNFAWSAGEVIIGDPTLKPVNSINSQSKTTRNSYFPFRRITSNVSTH